MLNFVKIIKYKSTKSEQDFFKESILINFILTISCFFFAYAIIYLIINHINRSINLFFYGVLELILITFFIKNKIKYSYVVNLGILASYIYLCIEIYNSKGLFSPSLPWVILAPIVSFILLEKSISTRFWSSLSLITILIFGLFHYFGIRTKNNLLFEFETIYYTASYIGLVFMLIIITNIFEKKKRRLFNELEKKQKELIESENRFRTIFEKAPLGIVLTNSGEITSMNKKYEEIIGENKNINGNLSEIEEDLKSITTKKENLTGYKITKQFTKPDNSIGWLDIAITQLNNEDKLNAQQLCILEDITERKIAEELLKYKELEALKIERNNQLLHKQNILLELSRIDLNLEFELKIKLILEKTTQIINCNKISIWVIKDDEITKEYAHQPSSLSFHIDENFRKKLTKNYLSELNNNNAIIVNDNQNKDSLSKINKSYEVNNSEATLSISIRKGNDIIGVIFCEDGKKREWSIEEITFINSVSDITSLIFETEERIKAENKIKQSLKEKEVLLKEVHHRVKNNLQIISSILNLQSSTISDASTLNLLKNSQDRIRSMSLIHELLYQTKDFSTINFSKYIRSISTNLFQSYNQNKLINLELHLESIFLELDVAISCGLIINELITNSLKYGFENRETGLVKIYLHQIDSEVIMIIEDDGKGFPSTIDFKNT